MLCSEVAMTDAEKESEARCKAMLNQLIAAVKKQTLEMEDLAVQMNELAIGLKAVVQSLGATVRVLPPPLPTPTVTLVTAVDHAVAAAPPRAEATLAPESPTKCSTLGPDTVKPTRCSTACHSCNTDIAITSHAPSIDADVDHAEVEAPPCTDSILATVTLTKCSTPRQRLYEQGGLKFEGLIKVWFRELPGGMLDSLPTKEVMQCQSDDDCYPGGVPWMPPWPPPQEHETLLGLFHKQAGIRSTMRLVKHPNVLQLFEVRASKSKIYFVLEYAKGGVLFNKIAKGGKLSEDAARRYFHHMIDECIVLEESKERPVMYLFTNEDDEHHVHFVVGSTSDEETEAQYIALINGYTGSGKKSSAQGPGSASASDLGQLMFDIDDEGSLADRSEEASAYIRSKSSQNIVTVPPKASRGPLHMTPPSFRYQISNQDRAVQNDEVEESSYPARKSRNANSGSSVPSESTYPVNREQSGGGNAYFTPQTGGGPPSVCLNRLNQTPNSPVAAGSSGGRKTSNRIILVCQGATQNSPEISLAGMGYAPLNMLGIIQSQKTAELLLDPKVNSIFCSPQVATVDAATTICEVQEAAGCLCANCVPRYVEMKKLLELGIDDVFQTKQKSVGEIVQSGWLGSMEYRTLEGLWAQSKDAWQALLNELPHDTTSDGVHGMSQDWLTGRNSSSQLVQVVMSCVYQRMREGQPNVSTVGMLIGLYQKTGNLLEAEFTFAKMRECNVKCVNACSAMITLYTCSSLFAKSEEIISLMKDEEVIPNMENCTEARRVPESYMCRENTECYTMANGIGYRCNCSKGFVGNPCLQGPGGFQDEKNLDSESLLKPILSADEFSVCVHGTYRKNLDSILQSGLIRMARLHVHFSSGLPSDGEVISGMRRSVNILIYLDVSKALQDEMKQYISDNRDTTLVITVGGGLALLVVLLMRGFWTYWLVKKRRLAKLKQRFFLQNGGLLPQQQKHGGDCVLVRLSRNVLLVPWDPSGNGDYSFVSA